MGFTNKHLVRIAIFSVAFSLSFAPARAHAAKLYVVYASISGSVIADLEREGFFQQVWR